MMNHKISTVDTTELEVYYTLTEGCALPTLPVSAIWNRLAPADRKHTNAARKH